MRNSMYLHGIESLSIKRSENVSANGQFYIDIEILIKDKAGDEMQVVLFGVHRDSFTEAAKDLILNKPIFIERSRDEEEDRKPALEPEEAYEI